MYVRCASVDRLCMVNVRLPNNHGEAQCIQCTVHSAQCVQCTVHSVRASQRQQTRSGSLLHAPDTRKKSSRVEEWQSVLWLLAPNTFSEGDSFHLVRRPGRPWWAWWALVGLLPYIAQLSSSSYMYLFNLPNFLLSGWSAWSATSGGPPQIL